MRHPRFRIRTLMIAVALAAVVVAFAAVKLQGGHLHDFYFTFGSPR